MSVLTILILISISGAIEPETIGLPVELDWRRRGVVNPVPVNRGACTATPVISMIESSIAINHGQLLNLSDQQMINCQSGACFSTIDNILYYGVQHGICHDQHQFTGRPQSCQTCQIAAHIDQVYHYLGEQSMLIGLQRGPITALMDISHLNWYHGDLIGDNIPSCTYGTGTGIIVAMNPVLTFTMQ